MIIGYLKANLSVGSQQQNNDIKALRRNNIHLRILYPAKDSINFSGRKKKRRHFMYTKAQKINS